MIGLNRSKIDGSTSKTLQSPRKQRETITQIDYQLYKLEVRDNPTMNLTLGHKGNTKTKGCYMLHQD